VYEPDLAIVSGLEAFATALANLEPLDTKAWHGESAQAHVDYVDSLRHTPSLALWTWATSWRTSASACLRTRS